MLVVQRNEIYTRLEKQFHFQVLFRALCQLTSSISLFSFQIPVSFITEFASYNPIKARDPSVLQQIFSVYSGSGIVAGPRNQGEKNPW